MRVLLAVLIFLHGILFFGINASGQIRDSDLVISFERYQKQNYTETIFVHFDKRYYLAGEFVKFKVFCLEQNTSKPSQLSSVAYVELLDHENKPQIQATIELKNGSGYGDFYIPLEVNSGNYILRGYTRWMRNDGPETFFHTMVTIINPFKKPELPNTPDAKEISLHIFAESGTLINGVKSRIVFHAQNSLRNPVSVTGRIVANDTLEVASFSTDRFGIGSCDLTPDLRNRYHIELFQQKDTTRHEFLQIDSHGLSISVSTNPEGYSLEIFCNDPSIVQPSATVTYVIHSKGMILHSGSLNLQRGRALHNISQILEKQGMMTLSLFEPAGNILGERTIFRSPVETNSLNASSDKPEYLTREKVELKIRETVNPGDFSVSVSSIHPSFMGNTLNLREYLLLENSIKWFAGMEDIFRENPETMESTINDLLIAYPAKIPGRSFATDHNKLKFIAEHRRQLITGKVIHKTTGEPGSGIIAYLAVPGKQVKMFVSRASNNGSVTFEATDFYNKNEIVVQTDYTIDSLYTVQIDNPYSEEYAAIELPLFDLDETMEQFIVRKSRQMQVQNANMKLSPAFTLLPRTDSSAFYYEPDIRYYLDDYTRFVVMEEVMREYIAGVNVRKNRNGFYFMVVDTDRNIVMEPNPLMLLDGVPIFDADEIIALDPLKIEKIETVRTRFAKGILDCQGIVSYTSYTGDMAGHSLQKYASVTQYDGLQAKKVYHFPTYMNAYERKNPTPDFRNTLFWKTNISDAELSLGTIPFYCGDDADDYEVRINGISASGEAYSSEATFRVKRQHVD